MESLATKFYQHLCQEYANGIHLNPTHSHENLISEYLLSPHTVSLPETALNQIQKFIQLMFQIKQHPEYTQLLQKSKPENIFNFQPGNHSIMMSYDFHYSPEFGLKLIEINTNASFLILSYEFYKMQKTVLPVQNFSTLNIKESIEEEWKLNQCNLSLPHPFNIWIVDDAPEKQKLFVEFQVYQELFKKWGWSCSIKDSNELSQNAIWPHFIYNRDTDFYLKSDHLQNLKSAWSEKKFCLSPQPQEYFLLADKSRLQDLKNPEFLKKISLSDDELNLIHQTIPDSVILTEQNKETLWQERKKFFFKPLQSFGSKQTYKGASMSRRHYEELQPHQFLAQEYIPASEINVSKDEKMKFDLRCFAYQGKLQTIIARLYQGQVTNLRTPGGGFALVTVS